MKLKILLAVFGIGFFYHSLGNTCPDVETIKRHLRGIVDGDVLYVRSDKYQLAEQSGGTAPAYCALQVATVAPNVDELRKKYPQFIDFCSYQYQCFAQRSGSRIIIGRLLK